MPHCVRYTPLLDLLDESADLPALEDLAAAHLEAENGGAERRPDLALDALVENHVPDHTRSVLARLPRDWVLRGHGGTRSVMHQPQVRSRERKRTAHVGVRAPTWGEEAASLPDAEGGEV